MNLILTYNIVEDWDNLKYRSKTACPASLEALSSHFERLKNVDVLGNDCPVCSSKTACSYPIGLLYRLVSTTLCKDSLLLGLVKVIIGVGGDCGL